MTEQQHPITPSPKLIEEWIEFSRPRKNHSPNPNTLATYAARWGADQELEACIKLLADLGGDGEMIRRYRRPRTLSLKEQALQALENADGSDHPVVTTVLTADQHALLRRALESLPS